MAATISVPQAEANQVFSNLLIVGEELPYKDLKKMLEANFPGINANQVSGLVHRAHANEDGVLEKVGKNYRIRSLTNTPNTQGDHQPLTIQGIDKVKVRIRGLLSEVEKTPASEFETIDDFIEFKKIRSELKKLSK